jgi:hypothetical protein|tara:strand:+ start:4138 stop:4785 length:648 start_codon:yes stop_codon:yes gene_type:complete
MTIHNSEFFDNFGQVLNKYPGIDIQDLFSKGQIESKRWLVNELEKINMELGTVFICAGWYGSLATFLFESDVRLDKIRSFDIDESCAGIAETFNRLKTMDGWKFKASTLDILGMDYPTTYTTYRSDGTGLELTEMPNTVINTSCEHIENFAEWYDKILAGTLIILQTNNFFEIPEHVNCSIDLDDFSRVTPMKEVLYQGQLELSKYTRYMRIGIK